MESKYKILIVEDEENICQLIQAYLNDEFETTFAYDGGLALTKFEVGDIDLVILDIMLPVLSGWEVCRRIRAKSDIPIIMLTAKDEALDKIVGLEIGADDYVTKPFDPRELLARVKAVLRRYKGNREDFPDKVEYPGLLINNATRKVYVNAQELDLTLKEFELLWLFATNPGIAFSREHLIQKVWGYDYLGASRAIDSTVKRLRRKLEAVAGGAVFIQTIWGLGYKFEVPK